MQDRASFTAETVALMRALETHRGAGRRLFVDPLAEPFTRGRLRFLARWSARSRSSGARRRGLYDRVAGPGPRPSAVARTRFIDDVVTGRAPEVDQVVLLGAGFDTRAHRLPALASVTDVRGRPSGNAGAQDRGGRGRGSRRAWVVYVPVDFERDLLDRSSWSRSGFDPARPSVFVWEGVTNYLTGEAVDATLAMIRELARAGEHTRGHLRARRSARRQRRVPRGRRWVQNVQRAGEPWTFGLDPGEVPAFLRSGLRAGGRRLDTRCRPRPLRRPRSARAGLRPVPRRGGGGGLMPKVSDAYRDSVGRSILDAAVACFERRGLHGTTTDDIAAEAGIEQRRALPVLRRQGRDHRSDRGRASRPGARAPRCRPPRRRSAARGARLRGGVLRVARRSRRVAAASDQRARVGRGPRRRAAGRDRRRRGRAPARRGARHRRRGRVGRAPASCRRRRPGAGDPGAVAGLRAAGGVGSGGRRDRYAATCTAVLDAYLAPVDGDAARAQR